MCCWHQLPSGLSRRTGRSRGRGPSDHPAARQHIRELMSTTHTYPWLIPIITWCRPFLFVTTNILLINSLCNPRDQCTHSLCQDCYTVELITSNLPTYLHMGITLWLGVVLYALVPETMHGIIVGKRVRTRQISDRYCTRVWMSGMFWCDQ